MRGLVVQSGRTLQVRPFVASGLAPRVAVVRPLGARQERPSAKRHIVRVSDSALASAPAAPAITLTENALSHLRRMRERKGEGLLLRMGVKSGGCSGMSYTMEFEEEGNVGPKDTVMEYDDGFRLVCDAKSLVYLFGMSLDYSDELIGGGFKFRNPNAERSCGCGKSFKAGA